MSKTTKPAKKKPDHEILSVGDRLSVVVRAGSPDATLWGEGRADRRITCEVLDVVSPIHNLRVGGKPVVAWAEVVHPTRRERRRGSWRVDDRVAVLKGEWRMVRRALADDKPAPSAITPDVPWLHGGFAPEDARSLGIPETIMHRLTAAHPERGDLRAPARAPVLEVHGYVGLAETRDVHQHTFVEGEFVRAFVRSLFRERENALEALFGELHPTLSTLTRYKEPAIGVKTVLTETGGWMADLRAPDGMNLADWILSRSDGWWARIVICRIWLEATASERESVVRQYRGVEAARAFFSPAQPDAAGAYEGIKSGDTIKVPY